MPSPATASSPRSFGRFALRRLLGSSRRSMLWLADDARDGRELLLSLPRAAPPDPPALEEWLTAARQAARLAHPHLAPVTEAGAHERWPYIACDRSLGLTLAEHLAVAPQPSHQDIAGWLVQALEGLAFAHDAGIAHGDLQRHQLLVDGRGQVLVMALSCGSVDGECADPLGWAAPRGLSMDPLRLRQQRDAAERDVLAVGILAHALLAGAPAFDEPDIAGVIERLPPIGREVLTLPWSTPQPVAEGLRAIVNRATHHQPRQRYLKARSLLRALDGWRIADANQSGGPVALLLERLTTVGHLPALPEVSERVARLARIDRAEPLSVLAKQVLLDLGLSLELLRQVNSARVQATQASGNAPVLTVRRAIAMLGLDGLRGAAAGLRLWPGPLAESGAAALQQLLRRVRWAGHLAQRLRPAGYDAEIVFVLAVLQNLGRLMLYYHFAEDAQQVAQLMRPGQAGDGSEQPGMSEQAATFAVLGTDVDAMTLAVARHWGLPDEVLHLLRRLPADRPVRAADGDADVLRATASAANEAIDAVAGGAGAPALDAIARRYARALGLGARDLADAVDDARESLEQNASPLFEPAALAAQG
jgi:non-specific serine/threonine protein kinase